MSIVNFVPTRDGKKASAVCEFCDRKSRPVLVNYRGEPDLWLLPRGWAQAPYSADVVHGDGSSGSLWRCPTCDGTLRRHPIAVHPSRVAARAEIPSVQIGKDDR